jgi:hypothetical protein
MLHAVGSRTLCGGRGPIRSYHQPANNIRTQDSKEKCRRATYNIVAEFNPTKLAKHSSYLIGKNLINRKCRPTKLKAKT